MLFSFTKQDILKRDILFCIRYWDISQVRAPNVANKLWNSDYQRFYKLMKEIRVSAGLTQKELAHKLNKPQSYISKYESGERRLDIIEITWICRACKYSLAKFSLNIETQVMEPS